MKIINQQFQSPNFDDREGAIIDMIVVHSTHMTFKDSIERLCDEQSKVSCHYVIDLDGSIYQLVQDSKRAWHAGQSFWRGREKLNNYSVGIELVDTDATGARLNYFNDLQMKSIISLCLDLITQYNIKPCNIVAHSDIAPSRKDDPGEFFNWSELSENGVGIYHSIAKVNDDELLIKYGDQGDNVKKIQMLLADYGYKINVDGVYGEEMQDVVIAFKRHFAPSLDLNGDFSKHLLNVLEQVLTKSA